MRATRQGANFIVVLISLVTVFKSQISSLVNTILDKITKNAKKV